MTARSDATAPRVLDNNSLADTLISLAGLLRLNPQICDLHSVRIARSTATRGTWHITLQPRAAETGAQDIDQVRAFAALLGPAAQLHLSVPHTRTRGGTYRELKATGSRGRALIEMWTFIDDTPAPADHNAT